MAGSEASAGPTLAVFSAAALPGDAEFTRVLSSAGSLFARNGARLVCLVENGAYCRPLVTAALAAGGVVTLLSDGSLGVDAFDAGVTVELVAEEEARLQHLSDLADAFVGFPAGVASVRALFNTWVLAGGGSGGKPVALLNRNRAYEVLRGYAVDVLAHSLGTSDKLVIFADSVEDLWSRLETVLATN